jgi:uncharacterized protein YjbJ (UPF0337 family)
MFVLRVLKDLNEELPAGRKTGGEIAMTKLQEKAQAQVKQAVGQIVGDDKLVVEGKQQQRNAERTSDPSDHSKTEAKEEQKDKSRHSASSVNKPTSEQSSDATGRKGPVLE